MNYAVISHLYNEEKHLETMLESIYRQTIHPTGYFIVDDGSTDTTPDIIEQHGHPTVTLYSQPETPAYTRRAIAFNVAVLNAIDKYDPTFLLKIDGDTEVEPEYVEKLLAYMNDPRCAASSGKGSLYDKTRDLNNGAVFYRSSTLPSAKTMYGWDREIQLELTRQGYTFHVAPNAHYIDLRPPTIMSPSITRVIKNRVRKRLAEIEGKARRGVTTKSSNKPLK